MKRLAWIAVVALPLFTFALAHPFADVKTKEQTNMHAEGMLGFFLNRTKAAKEGVVNTAAVKGNRKATTNEATGEIIDLSEEKVYSLDMKKKEYSVKTFEQIRQEWRDSMDKAKAQQEKQEPQQPKGEPQQPQKEYEIDFDVKETGQKKQLLGYDTKETLVIVTVRQKGMTLEQGGGMVMTNDMWLAPRVPELRELQDFNARYWKQLHEGTGLPSMSPEQMAQVMASLPLFGKAMERMQKDGDKVSGTAIDTTMTLETVKDPAEAQAQSQSQPTTGGGIGGLLAHKMMKKSDSSSSRSTPFTTHHQYLEIAKSVDASDLAIPAGFKEVTPKK
jgi:hypothetical protein